MNLRQPDENLAHVCIVSGAPLASYLPIVGGQYPPPAQVHLRVSDAMAQKFGWVAGTKTGGSCHAMS